MKLNIGCGEFKFDGFVNVDMVEAVKPNVVCDVRKLTMPFAMESFDEVWCSHNLEHIEFIYWEHFFFEVWNILKEDGLLVLVYPEFGVCAKYFVENHNANRSFWRVALYGRQAYPGDYHVVPVVTAHLISYLQKWGFKEFKHGPEAPGQEYATMLACKKGARATKEDVYKEVIDELIEVYK